mgnify:CR=1 FL=1
MTIDISLKYLAGSHVEDPHAAIGVPQDEGTGAPAVTSAGLALRGQRQIETLGAMAKLAKNCRSRSRQIPTQL